VAEVIVSIGGHRYPLACRDGNEARVREVAGELAAKAERLVQSLGPMTEARLLLMAGLMVADELHDLRGGKLAAWVTPPSAPAPDAAALAAELRLEALAARAEALADRFAVPLATAAAPPTGSDPQP
jgi:cell division protein ZapA